MSFPLPQPHRFEVALSFAGDGKRPQVRAVAELLRRELGDGKVFFDEWFEAELAGLDAHIVLQNIYRKETRLVVTCVCKRYNEKPWTQEEWRAIQAFERKLRDTGGENKERMRFLPLRFGDGEVDGIFETAIIPDVRSRTPEQIAGLVLERLRLTQRELSIGGEAAPEQKHVPLRNRGMAGVIMTQRESSIGGEAAPEQKHVPPRKRGMAGGVIMTQRESSIAGEAAPEQRHVPPRNRGMAGAIIGCVLLTAFSLDAFYDGFRSRAPAETRDKPETTPPPFDVAMAPSERTLGPIKVGILHSLSGSMAIHETSLKDVLLMEIALANAAGGLLGRKLEPIVVDPGSNWPRFAEEARELVKRERVAVTFGCWTSESRKEVVPIFEELNALLFYPVAYEGDESSRNVFYTGATPTQQVIPLVDYLKDPRGGGAKRWVLVGTNLGTFPRVVNDVVLKYLRTQGVVDKDILVKYTPGGWSDYHSIVADVKRFVAGRPSAVISTISDDSNVPFYQELRNQGLGPNDLPVAALLLGEEELRRFNTAPFVEHIAVASYFMSIDTPENRDFVANWKEYVQDRRLPDAVNRVTNDAMEATHIGFQMWSRAVLKAGSVSVDEVRREMLGQSLLAPSGYQVVMDADHHLRKPTLVGEIQPDGQFDVLWKTFESRRARPEE